MATIKERITSAINVIENNRMRIAPGDWGVKYDGEWSCRTKTCCPLGALLAVEQPNNPMHNPSVVRAIMQLLNVNAAWPDSFAVGFDGEDTMDGCDISAYELGIYFRNLLRLSANPVKSRP